MAMALGWKVGATTVVVLATAWGVMQFQARNEAMRLAKEYGQVRDESFNAPEVRITTVEGAKELIPHLANVPDLYKVGIYNVPLTQDQLREISELDNVDVLHLGKCDLTDEDVSLLSGMSRIEHLSVSANSLTDKAFESIAEMKNLQKLDMSRTEVDGHLLGKLQSLPHLWQIRLSGTKVSDETVGELTKLRKLREISLNGTDVSADGVKKLAQLHWLQQVAIPEERVFGEATHENIETFKDTKWKFIAEFNELKRQRYQEAVAEGLDVPDRFVSPFPTKRWGTIEPSQ